MNLELEVKKSKGKKIKIHPKEGKKLGLEQGDLVKLTDDTETMNCIGKVYLTDEVKTKTVGIDQTTIDSLETDVDSIVIIEKYTKKLKQLEHVTFGIEPTSGQDGNEALMIAKESEDDLLKFMNNRAVMAEQKFNWDKYDMNIAILETNPKLKSDDVAIISREILGGFDYKLSGLGIIPFDSVLIIDVSASMGTEDIFVSNIGSRISHLQGGFQSKIIQEFLGQFNEGNVIERYNAAAISALIYLSEKVGRGKGEKVGFIPFSTEAEIVKFGSKHYFDVAAESNIESIAERIVEKISTPHEFTNVSDAFKKAIQITKYLGHKRMKMFVLLTDGKPYGVDNEDSVREIIFNQLAPRRDVVVNTAGIGTQINEDFLLEIANKCKGDYLHVDDLGQLADWYFELARSLKLKGEIVPDGTIWEVEPIEADDNTILDTEVYYCQTCRHQLTYIYKYSKWWCEGCNKYI